MSSIPLGSTTSWQQASIRESDPIVNAEMADWENNVDYAIQFSSFQSSDRLGHRGDMRDNSVYRLFITFSHAVSLRTGAAVFCLG